MTMQITEPAMSNGNALQLSWWNAERVSTLVDFGVLLIASITALTAINAIRQTREIIKQNEEAQTASAAKLLRSQERQEQQYRLAKESAERTYRPYMIARYLPPSDSTDDLELEISNTGRSVAKNVRVAFSPPLPEPNLEMLKSNAVSSSYLASIVELARAVFLGRTFKTVAPGQFIKAPLWSQNKNFKASNIKAVSAEGVPSKQGVTISYYDDAGTSYIDTFEIDPFIYAGNLFKESELSKIRKALTKRAR